jgi:crotonobetainyl-CoA:carnitine CoA-transferase CaiB-like acyl-CoA transferase
MSGDEAGASGPLGGVRVLEIAVGRVARISGMLLADLGADVVAVRSPSHAEPADTPESVCWDRGKRRVRVADDGIPALAAGADVILVDAGPRQLADRGWSSDSLKAIAPHAVHVWLPPYGEHGEWCDLPEDPLLLAAVGILAVYLPADDTSPVAPVAAPLTYLQAALAAAAATAGLVGRERQGVAQPVVVSGLHAAAVLMGTAVTEINGKAAFAPSRAITSSPNWRIYPCADGKGLFVAALTPDIFFRVLEAVDRLDVMALPEVAGDFQSIVDLNRGRRQVAAVLEPIFASRTSEEWIPILREHRVPCAVVQTRAEWITGPIIAANDGRTELEHPQLGPVVMPNVAIQFSETPGAVRGLVAELDPADAFRADAVWPPREPAPVSVSVSTAVTSLPLAGIRVVDGASFLAGPMVATLLADFGADAVRIEPPAGDTYRAYPLSFLAVNQRKSGIVIDLKQPEGRETLHSLLADADVLVENQRPRALAALGLGGEAERERYPQLVHCSVSAFGRSEQFSALPGFDPILQALNGMAVAQGGDDEPATCSPGVNDSVTGTLGALGTLAALYHRARTGRGQQLWVSLALGSTFLQSGEFTTWAGSPQPQLGATLFRGPAEGHRYYECRDGWIACAAITADERARLIDALGASGTAAIAQSLRELTVEEAVQLLSAAKVASCRVVPRTLPLRDPFLEANQFTHLVPVPDGIARVVDRHSLWPLAPEPRASAYFAVGTPSSADLSSAVGRQ